MSAIEQIEPPAFDKNRAEDFDREEARFHTGGASTSIGAWS
jgi:hypothetical protein